MFAHPAAKLVAALLGGFALLVAGFYLGRGTRPAAVAAHPEASAGGKGGVAIRPEPSKLTPAPEPAAHDPHPGHAGHEEPGEHHHFPPEIPKNAEAGAAVADPSRTRDLPGLLAGLQQAVADADPNLMTAYQNSILTFMRSDEARALQVFEIFKAEKSATVLEILASAIASNPAFAASPVIAEQFLALAEKSDEHPERRQAALYYLSQTYEMPAPIQERVATLARLEGDPTLQSSAITALAHFAGADEARAGTVNDQLVAVARSASDPMIRSGALAGVRTRAADENVIASVGEFLRTDRDPEVRRAAAESLGEVPVQTRFVALSELEKAYRGEDAAEVKRAILMSVVRAGRAEAGATLERLLSADATLSRDVQDYLEILRSGETDIDRIFEEKARRDLSR